MADINRESEELANEFNRLRETVQGSGASINETSEQLKQLKTAAKDGAVALGKGFKDFASQVGQGNTEFKSLNSAIDAASGAAAGLAKTIPFVGEAVSAALKATGDAAKFVVNQLDQTSKGFQQLSEVGAVTAKGMTGFQQQFIKSGMSMEGFKKAIIDNSNTLARWGTTVGAGADSFTKAVGDITKTKAGDELRRLGYGADQMGEAAAGFLKQQTLLGRQSKVTQENLGQSTVEYARELDQLTKLTGMSRKDAEKQREAALQEGKFLASIRDLQDIGPAGEKAAKEITAFQSQIAAVAPETAKGIRDLTAGNQNTIESQKLIRSTGGAAIGIMEQLKAGQIDSITAQRLLTQSVSDNEKSQRQYAKTLGDNQDVYTKYSETVALQGLANKKEADIREDLAKSSKAAKEGGDKLTDATVDAQKNMEEMNRQIQMMGFTVMPSAAKAIDVMTKSATDFTKFVNKTLGVEEPGAKAPAKGTAYQAAQQAVSQSPQVKAAEDAVTKAQAERAEAFKDSTLAQRLGIGRTKEQQAAVDKLDLVEKDLREKENSARRDGIAKFKSKEMSDLTGQEVEINIDLLKFKKADKENYNKYLTKKDELYKTELENLTKGKSLTAKQLQEASAKARAVSEQKAGLQFAGQISAAGAGSVTVGGGGAEATPTGGAAPSGSAAAAATGKDTAGATKTGTGDATPPKAAGGGGSMSEDAVKKMIIGHEGKRYEPYKDSLGLWTVGIGHLIGDGRSLPDSWNRKFSEEEVMSMFEKDYASHRSAAEKIPGFDKFNSSGQGALTDLTFNMGPSWIGKFPNTAKQIAAGNAAGAAAGLQDSKWFTQVGNRGPTIVNLMKNATAAKDGGILDARPGGHLVQAAEAGLNEAFVPLPNGKSIPVEIPGLSTAQEKNNELLTELLLDIKELVNVSKSNSKTSKDILRQARA